MAHAPVCINPVSVKERVVDKAFNLFVDQDRMDYVNQLWPYLIDFEANSRCAGSCGYCYASSDDATDFVIPKEKVWEIIDDAAELGVKRIQWGGGDALAHPHWDENVIYAAQKGITSLLATSGLISKRDARRIVELGAIVEGVGINLASIDQPTYNQVHTNPRTLGAKIQGYHNLLEAGYPADQALCLITLTRPVIDTVEETIDWFVDTMGCRYVCLLPFRTCGFGGGHERWEPTLSEVRRAMEYRARKLGSHWLKIGTSDGSLFYCRTAIAILYNGDVAPCTMIRERVCGNLYRERLTTIFERGRGEILFNHEIKGFCGGSCPHNDICFGCRATAYHYLGDEFASDPKCWLNPEAREHYYPLPAEV